MGQDVATKVVAEGRLDVPGNAGSVIISVDSLSDEGLGIFTDGPVQRFPSWYG